MSSTPKAVIIGSGLMGTGIAVVYLAAGYEVTLVDVNEEILKRSIKNIKNILEEASVSGALKNEGCSDFLERVSTTTSLQSAVRGEVEIVTEAVPEVLELKIELFRDLDDICEKDVILASNTSSFKISEIAQKVRYKERVVGTHWWNPPYLMPLVEIIRTDYNEGIIKKVVELFTKKLRKEVVVCKDSPGGIGVRLQAALFAEAMRMLDENLASPSDIDKVVRLTLGLRYPMLGPFQIADLGGLDVFLQALDYLAQRLGERFTPSAKLAGHVTNGLLGVKSGKGFYTYQQASLSEIVKRRNKAVLEILKLQREEDLSIYFLANDLR
ncbi:MAG: 3-hydroxyacyl-CoA dehydrogenase family protein [Nitrososphaerota archaeon]